MAEQAPVVKNPTGCAAPPEKKVSSTSTPHLILTAGVQQTIEGIKTFGPNPIYLSGGLPASDGKNSDVLYLYAQTQNAILLAKTSNLRAENAGLSTELRAQLEVVEKAQCAPKSG